MKAKHIGSGEDLRTAPVLERSATKRKNEAGIKGMLQAHQGRGNVQSFAYTCSYDSVQRKGLDLLPAVTPVESPFLVKVVLVSEVKF